VALGALLKHRTVIFLLVAAAAWSGWIAFVEGTAPGRIDPALRGALRQGTPLNVTVTLGFPPEDFHIRLFQGSGVVSGVQGTRILLNRVRPEEVRRIARYYWVRRITPQS
jgi:hypothetical protein